MHDYRSDNWEDVSGKEKTIRKQKKRLNLLASLLCYIMTDITKNAPKTLNRLLRNKLELRIWWREHLLDDAKHK